MNYKLYELYNKYTILSNNEQNTHFIQIASCLPVVPLLWNVASTLELGFTAQQFWWSWVFAPLEGTLLTMQCKWTFTNLYSFYTTRTARTVSTLHGPREHKTLSFLHYKSFILSTLQRKCPVLR